MSNLVINMLANSQNAGSEYIAQSGTVYTANANGYVIGVTGRDILDLLEQGCIIIEPSSAVAQFGSASLASPFAAFNEEGNLYRLVGNPDAANAADTTDDILGGVVIPANVLDISGRGINITAAGITGATTNNKRFKIWANPTISGGSTTNGVITGGTVTGAGSGVLIADSGAWVNGTTANNAAGWSSNVNLFKYGAAGSNTQYSQAQNILGALHGGIAAPVFTTLPENAAINIVVTGSSYTTGAANDVKLDFFEVNAMN